MFSIKIYFLCIFKIILSPLNSAMEEINASISDTELFTKGDSQIMFQRMGNFILVYVVKTPAISSGETVELGRTSMKYSSASPIFIGSSGPLYECYINIDKYVVTLKNRSATNITNAWYKGFAILG